MKRKLIFFDIDGTLSKMGENVSERTIAAIKAAQKNGHLCYVCTGRNYPVIDQQLLEIGFDGVVASAGGYVKMGNQVLFNQGFTPEVLQNLIEDMRKLPLLLIMEGENNTYLHVPTDIGAKMKAGMEQKAQSEKEAGTEQKAQSEKEAETEQKVQSEKGAGTEQKVQSDKKKAAPNSEMQRMQQMITQMSLKKLEEYDGETIYKISCMCPSDDVLKPLEEKYAEQISIVYHSGVSAGGMSNNEIAPIAVNKGTAVELLTKYYGIERENTIGFGDSMNDAAMLNACGMGICMSNGSEDLKEISKWICPSVEEDGVAQAMERMGLTSMALD